MSRGRLQCSEGQYKENWWQRCDGVTKIIVLKLDCTLESHLGEF